MSGRKIYVFAGWEDNFKIGRLFCDRIRGEEVFSFEYDNEWLKSNSFIYLDPTLPASKGRIYSPDKKLFGAFTDACPDRWGRVLIEREERRAAKKEGRPQRKMMEADFLLKVSDYGRQGGFRFSESERIEDKDGNISRRIPPMTELRKLENASREYEKGVLKDDETLEILLDPGSSLGGARPKANVIDENGSLWIAKFPSVRDSYIVGAWEKTTSDMAREIGIIVPETKLLSLSDNRSIFLSKRFDRNIDKRIHFASAMTMLGERDGGKNDVGYLDIAEKISEISSDPGFDLEEMFTRAAFDIAVSNQDNHLRNHGFLLKNGGWELSPAYDINPVPGAGELALNIDLNSKVRSFDTLLSTAYFYGLSTKRAKEIVKYVAEYVSENWEFHAKKNGLGKSDIEFMSSAFDYASEFAQTHMATHEMEQNREIQER